MLCDSINQNNGCHMLWLFYFIIVSLSVETETTAGVLKDIEIDYRLMYDFLILNKSSKYVSEMKSFSLNTHIHVVCHLHIFKCSFSAWLVSRTHFLIFSWVNWSTFIFTKIDFTCTVIKFKNNWKYFVKTFIYKICRTAFSTVTMKPSSWRKFSSFPFKRIFSDNSTDFTYQWSFYTACASTYKRFINVWLHFARTKWMLEKFV